MISHSSSNNMTPWQELEKTFPKQDASLLPLAGSALIGVWHMTGPLVAIAMDKYCCQLIVVIGLITCLCSMIICYVTESFWAYVVAYGFVSGVGMGCIFFPPLTCISYYFDKKVSLASGLAYTGSSIGYIILPAIEKAVIDTFSWRSVFLFEGLLMLGLIPTALMLPKVEEIKDRKLVLLTSRKQSHPDSSPADGRIAYSKMMSESKFWAGLDGGICRTASFQLINLIKVQPPLFPRKSMHCKRIL